MYKKIIVILIFLLVLVTGCSSEESKEPNEDEEVVAADEEDTEDEPTQEELNEELKKTAIEADFVELNGGTATMNQRVFAEGEVSIVFGDEIGEVFSLETEEGEGYGVYDVYKFDFTEVKEGEKVKIWGIYAGKDEDTGIPMINATIIEHID